MITNILAVNLCVTFLWIQRVNCNLLVLRPRINFGWTRTSNIAVGLSRIDTSSRISTGHTGAIVDGFIPVDFVLQQ